MTANDHLLDCISQPVATYTIIVVLVFCKNFSSNWCNDLCYQIVHISKLCMKLLKQTRTLDFSCSHVIHMRKKEINRTQLLERVHFPCATSLKAPLVLLKRNSSLSIPAPLRLSLRWASLLRPDSTAESRGKGLSSKLIWFWTS